MITAESLDALLSERLSGETLAKAQSLLAHLSATLKGCPFRKASEMKAVEVMGALAVAGMQADHVCLVQIENPFGATLDWASREERISLVDASREAVVASIGKNLSEHLGDTYWQEMKEGLKEAKDILMYGPADRFAEQFRLGFGVLPAQAKYLAPDASSWRADSLTDRLWDSFCVELFYYLGLLVARKEEEAAKLEALVKHLPWLMPLGTHADNPTTWLIPCK